MLTRSIFLFILIGCINIVRAQVFYPGKQPTKAQASVYHDSIALYNNIFSVSWSKTGHTINGADITDTYLKRTVHIDGSHLFNIVLSKNNSISSGEFQLTGSIISRELVGNVHALRYAERLGGKQLIATFENKRKRVRLKWSAILRDSANYIQQTFAFTALGKVTINKVILIGLPLADTHVGGYVDGSPLINQNMFFALEHPLSKVDTSEGMLRASLSECREIDPTHSFVVSSAWGVTPEEQLRRGFLYYTEHERAAPYHQFLHYNSWFDISWSDKKLNDSVCLNRIQLFSDSLITKRHTNIDAFLFDDGWDNDKTLWGFNGGFTDGFKKEMLLANKFNAQLGVWISPWGGYNEAKHRRLEYGKLQNPPFETNDNGFSLSGRHYYNRFKNVAKNFINNFGVAIFKFDGIGNMDDAISVVKDTNQAKRTMAEQDFEALLGLTKELRKVKPPIYLSLTVGTWSSPYWLNYADVTWRSGEDNGQSGEGNERQRWLNYRDKEVYHNIVSRAPLYPLNAVMNHGICIADNGLPAKYEKDDKNIADEIWSFFGSGTSLQEMYINPHILSSNDWDCLAKAIDWSRQNADVLHDIHWIGGDPEKNEIYGYAAWKPGHGVLTLRNPSNTIKTYRLNTSEVFDIPKNYSSDYMFVVINHDLELFTKEEKIVTINLLPHEVLVLNAIPRINN